MLQLSGKAIFYLLAIPAMLFLGYACWHYFFSSRDHIDPMQIKFTCNNPGKEAPATFYFSYNLSGFEDKKVLLKNYGAGHHMPNTKMLSKEAIASGTVSLFQPFPGPRNIVLSIDGQHIDTVLAYAYTRGWIGILQTSKKSIYPSYIPVKHLQTDSSLIFSRDLIAQYAIADMSAYSFYFLNVSRDFSYIDGDRFTMETRFRNQIPNSKDGSRKTRPGLMFESGLIDLYFVMPGFKTVTDIFYAEVEKNGSHHDLSGFETDLDEWNTVVCQTRDHNIQVWLNDILIYQGTYTRSLGKMAGFNFKGYMEIDYVKLFDAEGNLFYEEGFEP